MKTKTTSLAIAFLLMLAAACAKAADTDAHITMIDEIFHAYNQPDVPGASVMVIRNGKILAAKSYGLADLETKTPCTPDTDFRLASVTKQFTAMAIMILADNGKLSLDDPITKFFPEFPAYGNDIKVRYLLNHTSGLLAYEDLIPTNTTIPVLDINVLRLLEQQDKTYFVPGTQFKYSNTGFAFLALIVEQVSGMTYASFLEKQIFKPLKMTHSLAYEQGLRVVPNRALWLHPADQLIHAHRPEPDQFRPRRRRCLFLHVNDLFKWGDQSFYTTKLVSSKMLKQAFTPGQGTKHGSKGIEYGFGWFLDEYRGLKQISHSGDSIGFRTQIVRLPEKKFTVIILTNRNEPDSSGLDHLIDLAHKVVDAYLFDAK